MTSARRRAHGIVAAIMPPLRFWPWKRALAIAIVAAATSTIAAAARGVSSPKSALLTPAKVAAGKLASLHASTKTAISQGGESVSTEASPSNQGSPVIRALLAGQDARAAVADALGQTQIAKAKPVAGHSAFGSYADGVRQLKRALAATRSAWSVSAMQSARKQLSGALTSLSARRLLVDARIEQINRLVAAPSMPAVARQRWAAHRGVLIATVSNLDAAIQRASDDLAAAGRNSVTPSFDELNDLVDAESRASAPPTYATSTLPMFRPRLAARDPATTPAITPSYSDAANEDVPIADDYAATDDAPLSAAILDRAQSLGHDYTRIFDFVRSQVRTQWYAGAQKGADTTLRTLAGNDADQASLLISLLRASGAPARYVRGVLDVPVGDLGAMLGVRADEVGLALGAAGVPNRPLVSAGRISGFAIEHVYVSAYLPFSNYRGTAADLDGRTWVPLVPAIKAHAFTPATGALARVAISVDDFVQQYLSTVQIVAPIDLLRQQVSDGLSRLSPPLAYADQLSKLSINASSIELLPASSPVPIEAVTGEFAQLPDVLRQHAHIVVRSGSNDDDSVVFDRVIALEQLLDHRVTLAYEPASIDDGRIADQHGGLGSTPPYLIHVRPILNIAGLPAASGTGEIENGATHRVDITVDCPAGTVALSQQLTAGGNAALVFDAQDDHPPEQADDTVLPGESESKAARLLANFGARYLSTWDRADDELAQLVGVGVVRPFPSIALVINQYRVDRVAGVADALVWRGVGLDAALRPVEPFAQSANVGAAADWTELASVEGSVLEHQLFEQQWSVDSISADKGLALARVAGQPVLTLNQMTGTAGVNQPQPVLDNISAWLSQGYVVDVPRDPVTYEDWSGAVWRVRSLSTGESGYFISGALAGGSTAMPPELWYFQDLAALLGNPYGQDPDDDPMSGVALSIDATAQYQDGIVGAVLAKPLRATVVDATGRPVLGAQVQFVVTTGTSKLIGADGVEAIQVVVETDRNGTATTRAHFGTSQGNFGAYRLDPNQSYPQWVGENIIEVSATAKVGALYAGQPYVEYALPDVPSKLALTDVAGWPLVPSLWYNPYAARVTDQNDNEISNVAVALSATTHYAAPTCGNSGNHVDTIDAMLFAPGQCPTDASQLTGDACATPSLAVASRPGGATFFVVPPATGLATVAIAGSAAGAGAQLQLTTDASFNACSDTEPLDFATLWAYAPEIGFGPAIFNDILDAAPLGQVMPTPQRFDIFSGLLELGDHVGVHWRPIDNATFSTGLQNGSIDDAHSIGGGSYLLDLRAGPDPGAVHGHIYVQWEDPQTAAQRSLLIHAASTANSVSEPFGDLYAWAVDVRAPVIMPTRIPLTPFDATDATIHIQADVLPVGYIAAPAQIDLLQGDDVVQSCTAPLAAVGGLFCDFTRGWTVDTTKSYTARVVLNDGTPFRFESPRTPLAFGQGIVGGYGVLPHTGSGNAVDELALVQGRYPKSLAIRDDIDVASGYSCTVGPRLSYFLSQDATITLVFHKLDEQGSPSPVVAWTALDNVAAAKGLQDVLIGSADLPVGAYQYELKATAADGSVEDYTGVASHHVERHDSLPLAHSFVKGVDLYSGGAIVSEEDIAVGGRGPGMKLTRTYASHQGDERSFFGRGWSSDLDSQVQVNDCDTRIVTGAAGQGQRFAPAGADPDGTVYFTALHGYHGTLVQKGAEYDFYSRDGTRYHFGQVDTRGPRLSYVEDTNGNRIAYTYEVNQGAPHVTRIDDAAGRHIDLTYVIKDIQLQQSGITIDDTFTIVADALGPGGLHVHYDYDSNGNLTKATRSDGTSGSRVHGYGYQDLGGTFVTQPDGEFTYYRFGYRLVLSTNLLDNASRSYAYQLGWSAADIGAGKIVYLPDQRATSVTEPDAGVTGFVYPEVRGLTSVTTDVLDARGKRTHYALNRYGSAEIVTDPVGTTLTEWDLTHLEPHKVTDALGTVTTYAYDAAGNKTSEAIEHSTGTIARSWTYKPQEQFSPPLIRDRVDTATDGNGNITNIDYDTHGNRKQMMRGGIVEKDSYDPNGDHASHTDGLGHFWQWRHDGGGYPREAEDPLHHVAKMTYDDRGRKLDETDANGHKTTYSYDAQDRLLTTTYPATDAGTGVQTTVYDDVADKRIDTNPNNHSTTSSFDKMGRMVGVQRTDASSRTLEYDFNGNLIQENDFSGDVTKYIYDDANRRHETDAPESRTTITDYDALGHVIRETVGSDDDKRAIEYAYQHPLYKRTLVRRYLKADTTADEQTQYDNNGNATQVADPVGRVTIRKYDARDRMFEEDAPYGRVTATAYYDNDLIKQQTVTNPGHEDQITSREYDDADRLTATTDAVKDRRTTGYDNTKNVANRSDARGNLTQYQYNARDELTKETGPEEGQITSYEYDLAGNRVIEAWANGNVRTSTYDSLERRKDTKDSVGTTPVESFTYTLDDQIQTRTDANSHTITNHYDGLHRLYKQDLPPVAGQPRTILKGYNVHGDVISETDPGGHTTAHGYDSLGRRIFTKLPDVDGQTATLGYGYDLIDRLTQQTDARNNQTKFAYDDVVHTKTEIDPPISDGSFTQIWAYDSVGNQISHGDRRGIVTTTSYYPDNRIHTITRDGLTTSTRTYEDGRVKTDTDANQRLATNLYDKAGRRYEEDRPLGARRTWTYWPMGDVHTATDADGRRTSSTYTLRRYPETETNNAGETVTYGYDGEGHRTAMQRPMGAEWTWTYAYDEGDRLIRVKDPYQHETGYGYDLDGNRTSQTDANQHTTTFLYDERHRQRSMQYPATTSGAASAQWTYDADGNVLTQTTPNARTRSFIVDALNRITSETVSPADPAEIAVTAYQHDGNGNLTQIAETLGGSVRKAIRSYDAFDRIDTDTDVHDKALQYGYDAVGNRMRLTDVTDPNNAITVTGWTYNALNQNDSVTVPGQGTTDIDSYPSGLVHVITRPDGGITTTGYDTAGRIASIVHAKGGSEIAHEAYRYDLNGNRLEQDESNGAVTGNIEQKTTYLYDQADRLTDVLVPDRTTHYVLDAVGNRQTEHIQDSQNTLVGNSTLAYNEREQLVTRDDPVTQLHVELTYDADGNTRTETDASGTRTYTVDAHDRVIALSIPGQLPLTFDYQSDGLRLEKHQGSAETRYQYDGQSLLAETNAIGNTRVRYHYSASQLLSRSETSGLPAERQYLLDALHTPIALLTQDGAVSARTSYDAWGEIRAQQGTGGALSLPQLDGTKAELPTTDQQAIGFTGYLKDSESGLYYAKARYYDPRIARFATQDTEEGKAMEPPSLHRYLYAYANPTAYMDPTGKYGIFFDGTDNNKDKPEFGLRTNVAKLYELYTKLEGKYVSGVGTEDADHGLGGAFGYGSDRRVEEAYGKLVNFYNSSYAKDLRKNDPEKWQHEKQIDLFGFSRGSATARLFANVLKERGIPNDEDTYTKDVLAGYGSNLYTEQRIFTRNFKDVDVRFLGIFDTVDARGYPPTSPFRGDLVVDPGFVRHTTHLVAANEYRGMFDSTSALPYRGAIVPNIDEILLPGCHSDIGGSYPPLQLEGSLNVIVRHDGLDKLPLWIMWSAAKKAGVPLDRPRAEDSTVIDPTRSSDDALAPYIHDSRTEATGLFDFGKTRTFYYENGSSSVISETKLIHQWRSQHGIMERVTEGKNWQETLEPSP